MCSITQRRYPYLGKKSQITANSSIEARIALRILFLLDSFTKERHADVRDLAKRRRFRELLPAVNKKSIIARRSRENTKLIASIAAYSEFTRGDSCCRGTAIRGRFLAANARLDQGDRIARDGFAGIPRAFACANRS